MRKSERKWDCEWYDDCLVTAAASNKLDMCGSCPFYSKSDDWRESINLE